MQHAWFKGDTCKDSEDISQSREFYSRLNEGGEAPHHANVCKIPRLCGAYSSLVFNKIRRFKAFFSSHVDGFSLNGPSP